MSRRGFEWQAGAGDGFLQPPAGELLRGGGGRGGGVEGLCVKDVETLLKRQAVCPPTRVALFTLCESFGVFFFWFFSLTV